MTALAAAIGTAVAGHTSGPAAVRTARVEGLRTVEAGDGEAVGAVPGAADADLVRRSEHEPELFGVLFDQYFAEIHRYVARRVDVTVADDIAADTFLAAFRQRTTFDPARGSARGWLYGIATRLVAKHRRQEVRTYRAMARAGTTGSVPVDDGHEDRVAARVTADGMSRQLAGALARLSHGERDVLLLTALAGLNHREVAAALGIAYGTVCSRLNRTRKKLRTALGGIDPTSVQETRDG